MTGTITPLRVSLSKSDPFDRALIEISTRGHHSKCAFGNKWKVVASESSDVNWHPKTGQYAKFMPERGVVRFPYGDMRFEQQLTAADIAWLDKFDTGEDVRSRTITLDPGGPATEVIRFDPPRPRTPTTTPKPSGSGGCNGHNGGNSGRAKRMRTLVGQRLTPTS